ncbi:MAG: T9SS type A sorting domain-containing protein [Candidatus Cloacimonetes bacterium]|nr:T9SS type A sorting domain-containing protein [Candidatus Cloacimonadota bacterium]
MKRYILLAIVILTICRLFAYDESYVVNQSGPGDFTDIMSAVNAVQTSASICVIGTASDYTGVNNTNIYWDGTSKTIRIYGLNSPVIDCDDQSRAFFIENGTEEDIIQDITINNAQTISGFNFRGGGAIAIENGNPILDGIVFNNCSAGEYPCNNYWPGPENGGAVQILYANGAQVKNCTFNNNIAFHGGAIIVSFSDNVLFSNNIVYNNRTGSSFANVGVNTYSGIGAGAVFGECNNTIIENNFFYFNRTNHGASALYLGYGENNSVIGNKFTSNTCGELITNCQTYDPTIIGVYSSSGEIKDNIFGYNYAPDQPCNIIYNTGDVLMTNNSFIENQDITQVINDNINGELILTNCIFLNNDCDYISSGDVTLNYCSTYQSGNLGNGVTIGTGCLIDTNSQIDYQTYQPLWNSTVKSPCIDAGDPSITDSDGTPSDIGAVRAIDHTIDTVELIDANEGINWKCFPVLDDIYAEEDIASNVLYDIMLPPIPAALELVETQGGVNNIYYTTYWHHAEQEFTSVKGYKLEMNEAATIEITGFLEYPEQTINLVAGGENWLGYFLEESMNPFDALAEVLDKINRITTRTFTYIKLADNSWLGVGKIPRVPTLNYGDLVIVNCTGNGSFFWGEDGGGTVPKITLPKAQDFAYTEEVDYIPVYVELDLEALDNPTELGIFVEGECKGAEVIEDSLVQIRAYVYNDTVTFDPGSVEFQLSYGSRSENSIIDSYTLKENQDDPGIKARIDFSENQNNYYIVSFNEPGNNVPEVTKTSLDQNYPNPFNPSTTIAYSLQNDGMAELNVYNIKGQLVKTLVNGEQPAGLYEAVWNGKDNNEKNISSGVYFYKLSTKDETIMKKMLMLK